MLAANGAIHFTVGETGGATSARRGGGASLRTSVVTDYLLPYRSHRLLRRVVRRFFVWKTWVDLGT